MNTSGEAQRADASAYPFRHWLSMLKVGVIGFGGGSALIPVMEKELVRNDALTGDEYVQDTVIANITPGALPVKLAALSGTRIGGARVASIGALAVALPGALGTVLLLALFSQLGSSAIVVIEYASLGISAFIIYLLAHYAMKVLAPRGRPRLVPILIAILAFLASGAGRSLSLAKDLFGAEWKFAVAELSALGLVVVSLLAISFFSLFQYIRRRRLKHSGDVDAEVPRSDQTHRALRTVVALALVALGGGTFAFLIPPLLESMGFLGLIMFSTVTSFGGGEAYVGVADGFFVASGMLEPSVFYGQIVPVANALPGPILVKIAAGVAFVQGGWLLAGAAFLVSIGSCSALAIAVLAVYDRARNSLLIQNISTFILPVICGLLASTAMSMLTSNVRIATEASLGAWAAVVATILLAAAVPLIHKLWKAPDVLLITLFGALSMLVLLSL